MSDSAAFASAGAALLMVEVWIKEGGDEARRLMAERDPQALAEALLDLTLVTLAQWSAASLRPAHAQVDVLRAYLLQESAARKPELSPVLRTSAEVALDGVASYVDRHDDQYLGLLRAGVPQQLSVGFSSLSVLMLGSMATQSQISINEEIDSMKDFLRRKMELPSK